MKLELVSKFFFLESTIKKVVNFASIILGEKKKKKKTRTIMTGFTSPPITMVKHHQQTKWVEPTRNTWFSPVWDHSNFSSVCLSFQGGGECSEPERERNTELKEITQNTHTRTQARQDRSPEILGHYFCWALKALVGKLNCDQSSVKVFLPPESSFPPTFNCFYITSHSKSQKHCSHIMNPTIANHMTVPIHNPAVTNHDSPPL